MDCKYRFVANYYVMLKCFGTYQLNCHHRRTLRGFSSAPAIFPQIGGLTWVFVTVFREHKEGRAGLKSWRTPKQANCGVRRRLSSSICTYMPKVYLSKNIATGETSQAITPFHFFDYSNFHHWITFITR